MWSYIFVGTEFWLYPHFCVFNEV